MKTFKAQCNEIKRNGYERKSGYFTKNGNFIEKITFVKPLICEEQI